MAANAVVLVLGGHQISIAEGYLPSSCHIKFERDPLNIFRVKSVNIVKDGRDGDAKTIISTNTLFGDIIMTLTYTFM